MNQSSSSLCVISNNFIKILPSVHTAMCPENYPAEYQYLTKALGQLRIEVFF